MAVVVEPLTEVTPEVVEAFAGLIPQLSKSAPRMDEAILRRVVEADACTLLVARDGDAIVGTLTLVLFPIPTGTRAWIEDVVVDEAAGGKGVGKALTREALRLAGEAGAKTVELTSRPSREVANGMYRSLGFTQRETNVYRYDL